MHTEPFKEKEINLLGLLTLYKTMFENFSQFQNKQIFLVSTKIY